MSIRPRPRISAGAGDLAQDAEAIVHYRDANGIFKTLGDLEKVPGLHTKKIEGHRDRPEF
jgi:competence ComEA-like helix-hairpin-helix protein